jgi:hypothetical protein
VRFFAELIVNDEITVRGYCMLRVTKPAAETAADGDRLANAQKEQAHEAAKSGDAATVAQTAANAIAVAEDSGSAKTNATARGELARNLVQSLADVAVKNQGTQTRGDSTATTTAAPTGANSGTKNDNAAAATTDMSPSTKANIVNVLASMDLSALKVDRDKAVRGNSSGGATPTPTPSSAGNATTDTSCDESCRRKMKENVMTVVKAVLAQGTDGSSVDLRGEHGAQLLEVIATLAPDQNTSTAIRSVAETLAKQTPLGERLTVETENIKVYTTSFPGAVTTDANATAAVITAADGTKFTWPSGVQIPGASASSTVSFVASQQTASGLPTRGVEALKGVTNTVDFKVMVDGTFANVANMGSSEYIKCAITRSGEAGANTTTAVKFYNETSNEWSTQGIRRVKLTPTAIEFEVNHFTTFGGFEESAPHPPSNPSSPSASSSHPTSPTSGTPTTTSANGAAGDSTPQSTGISLAAKLGIGIGATVLVAGIAGMFLASRRTVQPAASTTEEVLLEIPRNAPTASYRVHPLRVGDQRDEPQSMLAAL